LNGVDQELERDKILPDVVVQNACDLTAFGILYLKNTSREECMRSPALRNSSSVPLRSIE